MNYNFKRSLLGLFLLHIFAFGIYGEEKDSMTWDVHEKTINNIDLKFTVFHMENQNSNNVIFYFHGAGGDHLTWVENGKSIRDSWVSNSIKPPIVVGISLGEKWNLTPASLNISENLSVIKNEVVNFMETEYGPFKQVSGIGVSMGGFNLLQMIIDDPDFFDKILLISPAVADLPPYPTEKELIKYVQGSNSLSFKQKIKALLTRNTPTSNIEGILYNWKLLVSNNDQWSNIDPFTQLNKIRNLPSEIVITCGLNDVYGFYSGSKKLFKIFEDKSVDTYLFPIKNRPHLIHPTDEVLYFTNNY